MAATPTFSTERSATDVEASSYVPSCWPQLLSREQLSVYLALSPGAVARICPVPPLDLGIRSLRWRRSDIDAWLSNLPLRAGALCFPSGIASGLSIDGPESQNERRETAVDRVRRRAERPQSSTRH